MKKIAILLILALMFSFAGCGQKTVEEPISETEVPAEPVIEKTEFHLMMEQDNRPVAVMIDNDGPSSRPQSALEKAYMIYEVIVEGGASRMMALFKDASAIGKVGPIRSSRHYFLDFALEHDAIYCHAGWSPKASSDIKSLKVNNINGLMGNDGVNYYRDYTYDSSWHNLYTDLNKLFAYGVESKKYSGTTERKHVGYQLEDTPLQTGKQALEIVLPYSTSYKVVYKYDADSQTYNRYIGTKAHMSQSGEVLCAKNILVYHLKNYNLNDGSGKGRQEVETVGSGTGYYITNGEVVDITWQKDSRTGKTRYRNLDGSELLLNPGNTYVQIMPLSSQVTIG